MARKDETIIEPTKKVVTKSAKALPKGRDPRDGRILAEESVAKRQNKPKKRLRP